MSPAPAHAQAQTTSTDCAISEPSPEFSDLVHTSPNHARVWRLYQAVFLRQPDDSGLRHWVDAAYDGLSLVGIASYFTDGAEFRNRYGTVTNRQFVRLVYRNILCRQPEREGEDYWTAQLDRRAVSRPGLIVNFTELREYLRFTATCHSIYPPETEVSAHCWTEGLVPLSQATLTANGYRSFDRVVARPGGGSGSFRGVEVDLTQATSLFATGAGRCSVASINGNWLVPSQKDGRNPGVLGIGVVDGAHVRGSSDRTDRGVFGLRVDPSPKSVVQVWPGRTPSPDDVRLNSVIHRNGELVIEQWHAAAEISPYLTELEPGQIVGSGEWLWAAAGIPLRIDGQTDNDFAVDYRNDPYTYQTLNHSFVAVDKDGRRLVFGATSTVDARDLVGWATANGYEELIKLDGGASTEFNVGGRAVVAGTGRDIPLWLGVGC
jgi:hypothetical protein